MRNIIIILSLLLFTNFKFVKPLADKTQSVLLVLTNPFNQIKFSKFVIQEKNGILIATNIDEEDYPINRGIYRVESASNDKYYHKKIVVL